MIKHGLLIHEDVVELIRDWSPSKLDKFLGIAFRECFDLPGPRQTNESGVLRLLIRKAEKADERRDKVLEYDRKRNSAKANGGGGTPTESYGDDRTPTESYGDDRTPISSVIDKNRVDKIPPLSPKGGKPPSVLEDPSAAGFPERAPAPISRDKCLGLSSDPMMSVQVTEEFCARWWDEHDHDGWIDDDGKPIRGMRRVRQLLAGAFKYQKNNFARAESPRGGCYDVFDPDRQV